ncbi:hypothetical protein HCG51_10565 [Tolypothrix sp. PCC 7910]|nr:hypothetical protein [Tolypothrix sp. PCC 7910]QIR37124.1 hypothetical protein HCG51_10565 [Tolypothrix sp. PCC 7910]
MSLKSYRHCLLIINFSGISSKRDRSDFTDDLVRDAEVKGNAGLILLK